MTKASACAKHFFAYSLENCFHAHDNCRLNFNANVTQQEMEDTYLPAFEASVKVGKVSGLMCSENAVNGVPVRFCFLIHLLLCACERARAYA